MPSLEAMNLASLMRVRLAAVAGRVSLLMSPSKAPWPLPPPASSHTLNTHTFFAPQPATTIS
jgi:hypothetical protein